MATQESHRRRVDTGVIRVGDRSTPTGLTVSSRIDFKRCRKVLFAARAICSCKCKIFVGSCEQPQGFAIRQAFVAERCQLLVGTPQCATARQCQPLKLSQPDIPWPVGQRLLDGVVSEQRLSHLEQILGFAYRGLRSCRRALRLGPHGQGIGGSFGMVTEVGKCA